MIFVRLLFTARDLYTKIENFSINMNYLRVIYVSRLYDDVICEHVICSLCDKCSACV